MKKIICILLTLLTMTLCAACGPDSAEPEMIDTEEPIADNTGEPDVEEPLDDDELIIEDLPECEWLIQATLRDNIEFGESLGLKGMYVDFTYEVTLSKEDGGEPTGEYKGTLTGKQILDTHEASESLLKNYEGQDLSGFIDVDVSGEMNASLEDFSINVKSYSEAPIGDSIMAEPPYPDIDYKTNGYYGENDIELIFDGGGGMAGYVSGAQVYGLDVDTEDTKTTLAVFIIIDELDFSDGGISSDSSQPVKIYIYDYTGGEKLLLEGEGVMKRSVK